MAKHATLEGIKRERGSSPNHARRTPLRSMHSNWESAFENYARSAGGVKRS
jgi:hypothetical protein